MGKLFYNGVLERDCKIIVSLQQRKEKSYE